MSPRRIDHTAIVVRDMDEALARYAALFGLAPSLRRLIPDQRVEVAFLLLGDTELELIQPTDSTSGVARFLDQRGEGFHHIALAVDDIRRELKALEELGIQLIDREPRRGAHGAVAFLHPKATGGVLVELVEREPE